MLLVPIINILHKYCIEKQVANTQMRLTMRNVRAWHFARLHVVIYYTDLNGWVGLHVKVGSMQPLPM